MHNNIKIVQYKKIRIIVKSKWIGIFLFLIAFSLSSICGVRQVVMAKQPSNIKVEYSYDSLGRIKKAVYPDGSVLVYFYDANGNLIKIDKTDGTEEISSEDSEDTTENKNAMETEEKKTESGKENEEGEKSTEDAENNHTEEKNVDGINGNSQYIEKIPLPTWNSVDKVQGLKYTEKDIKNYNAFKKKVPKIKSLKCKKYRKKKSNKKIYYLSIGIRQVNAKNNYGEIGYQISYSTSEKFKKSKRIDIPRRKKGKITYKKWKVAEGKTYYVKVRAYMNTKTGKKIYTKYSKVKKIKVEK